MAVAKRQGREKTTKIEKKKIWGLEWGPQVEQTALLASHVYIGQAQGRRKKHIKRGAKGPGVSLPLSSALSHVGALSLSLTHTLLQGSALPLFFTSFGSACPNALRMYFPSFSKLNWAVTRSCNTDLSESCDTVCPRAVRLVHRFKFLLWWDRTEEITHSPWHLKLEPLPCFITYGELNCFAT